MSLFEKYKLKRPAEFTRLVGVNYGTFQIILEKLEREITRFKQQQPMRQRGLKSSLTIADQLLLTLIYLRQYHTFLQRARNVLYFRKLCPKTLYIHLCQINESP